MKLEQKAPSNRWGEAFPTGNGQMGAMLYGSLPVNRIELTENTFYSGEKNNHNNQKGAAGAFHKMRELASAGEYDKVHEEANRFIGIRNSYGTNLPVGHFLIDYGAFAENIIECERTLDITDGIAGLVFGKAGADVREELFISHPDHILVEHISLKKGTGSVRISFLPSNEYGKVSYEAQAVLFTCYAYEGIHCDSPCGAALAGYARLVTDGSCREEHNHIIITGASDIKLYLKMATDFKRNFISKAAAVQCLMEEAAAQAESCAAMDYALLRKRHIVDVRDYMERVSFRLNDGDERQKKLKYLFQYGRYLLLSSSREDSLLPAHLQGIWNDNVACRIGWTCDMHLDINTQMNYWPSEITNMSETAKPLFRWIKEELAAEGAQTAEESYGLEGWVGEVVSNAWGFAAPYWASPLAPCPTGGIWVMMQMWEHYQYTGDIIFLRDELYPLLEAAVIFFVSYVFKEKPSGYYIGGPSISPENSFLYQGKPYQISNGCTYEILMIRELFTVYLKAGEYIEETDTRLQSEVEEKLEGLLPYRITAEGTIAEWKHELAQADRQHRHTSHLLGLYPFSQINPEDTPELCKAAERTLQGKLIPAANWEDTGWARAMLILYEARLRHGDKAWEHIKCMMDQLLEPNDMVFHPPTRGAGAFDHVYELDGNTGLTSCIAEMLLQSHQGILRLLPALPKEWDSGEIKGLRARGNVLVELAWEENKLQRAVFTADRDRRCHIVCDECDWDVELKKDVPYILEVIKES